MILHRFLQSLASASVNNGARSSQGSRYTTRGRRGRGFERLESRRPLAVSVASAVGFGSPGYQYARDVAIDAQGNTFLAGALQGGTLDLDPANVHADNADLLTAGGPTAAFVAKYASDGSFLWARQMTSAEGSSAASIATDAAGDVFVTGDYRGPAQLGAISLTPFGINDSDIFVTKVDAAGAFVWAQRLGAAQTPDYPSDIAVNAAGTQVYVSAVRNNVPATDNKLPRTRIAAYLAKVDATDPAHVATAWAHTMIASDQARAMGVAIDAVGNVYAAGFFRGTLDFNPGPAVANLTAGGGQLNDYGAFVWKVNSTGEYVWAKQFADGKIGGATANAIAVAPNGDVVVGGMCRSKADFDPGPGTLYLPNAGGSDAYAVRLNAAGTLVWAKAFGGAGTDQVSRISIDAAGDIYLAGTFTGGADFDPGPGIVSRAGSGVYASKLSGSGGFQWVATMQSSAQIVLGGLAVDSTTGKVKIVGQYSGQLNTDPDPDPLNPELTAADAYIFWLTLGQA